MDTSSFFIPDKCLFGSYPSKHIMNELESLGVRYFVDLTTQSEKTRLIIYKTQYNYINFESNFAFQLRNCL